MLLRRQSKYKPMDFGGKNKNLIFSTFFVPSVGHKKKCLKKKQCLVGLKLIYINIKKTLNLNLNFEIILLNFKSDFSILISYL